MGAVLFTSYWVCVMAGAAEGVGVWARSILVGGFYLCEEFTCMRSLLV